MQVIALLFLLIFIFFIQRNKDPQGKFFIFIFVLYLLYIKIQHAHFSTWDEFTHWAAVSKYLFLTNSLPGAYGPIQMPDYPPGAALFHYFIFKIIGYSEGHAYFAQDILLIVPLLCLFQRLSWRQWPYIISTIFFCYLSIFVFGSWSLNPVSGGQGGFVSLQMDLVLGIFFGCGLVCYYLSQKNIKNIFLILPLIFCLPLLKTTGIFFALLLCFIIMADQLILTQFNDQKKSMGRVILISVLLIITASLSYGSWQFYLYFHHIQTTYSSGITFSHIKQLIAGNLTLAQQTIISDFFHTLIYGQIGAAQISFFFKDPRIINILEMLIFMVFAVSILLFSEKDKLKRVSILNLNLCLLVGLILFVIGMLFVYLYSFQYYESHYISSYPRYLGTYFIAWFMINYAFLLNSAINKKASWIQKTAVWLLPIAGLIVSPKVAYTFLTEPVKPMLPVRANIQKLANYINQEISGNKGMYVVWQQSPGFIQNILAFEMIPRKINTDDWSLGKKYPGYDVWTKNITAKQFKDNISQYDYLFLAKTDKQFWNQYGNQVGLLLYKNQCTKQSCIFEIIKNNQNSVVFKIIPNIKIVIKDK